MSAALLSTRTAWELPQSQRWSNGLAHDCTRCRQGSRRAAQSSVTETVTLAVVGCLFERLSRRVVDGDFSGESNVAGASVDGVRDLGDEKPESIPYGGLVKGADRRDLYLIFARPRRRPPSRHHRPQP